jgi:hypothetical protein
MLLTCIARETLHFRSLVSYCITSIFHFVSENLFQIHQDYFNRSNPPTPANNASRGISDSPVTLVYEEPLEIRKSPLPVDVDADSRWFFSRRDQPHMRQKSYSTTTMSQISKPENDEDENKTLEKEAKIRQERYHKFLAQSHEAQVKIVRKVSSCDQHFNLAVLGNI